jgi:hypothetical protein
MAVKPLDDLVPRSPFWVAQKASVQLRARQLEETRKLAHRVESLQGDVQQVSQDVQRLKLPQPLEVTTRLPLEDLQRLDALDKGIARLAGLAEKQQRELQALRKDVEQLKKQRPPSSAPAAAKRGGAAAKTAA